MSRSTAPAVTLITFALLVAGCRGPAFVPGSKRYPLKGQVVSVDVLERKISIAHEDIEGFMPAMTMPFVVLEKDRAILGTVSPGDQITATLVAPDTRYWIEEIVVIRRGVPDPKAPTRPEAHEPRPGDVVPEVALVNQDGRAFHLSDFRGKAIGLTFIFTRCPLPDFCPLMMKSFADTQALLATDPSLAASTRLVSVSFDTRHDTPSVLRAYGMPFQKISPPFTHWLLASGTDQAIRTLGHSLGLDYAEDAGGFAHNLRTAVIDRDGTLFRLYRGGEWRPAELVADLRAASSD